MTLAAAEADRRLSNLIQIGTVTSVDAQTARAIVQIGTLPTPPIPVGQLRAGPLSFWWMPAPGEQVVVTAPGGDMARAIILCSVFAGNAPSEDAETPMISLPGGRLAIVGDLFVDGNIECTGTITAAVDVVAAGISLVNHTHGGVQPGGAQTGKPS